jgi:hypothetical protein
MLLPNRSLAIPLVTLTLLGVMLSYSQSAAPARKPPANPFDTQVSPVIQKSCTPCHNQNLASGEVSFSDLTHSRSLTEQRETWERAMRMIHSGEMPPPGSPKPANLAAVAEFLSQEFERQDRNAKPEPGRITARHLNRVEYRNTIRDLLGVEFQSTQEFPVDDSGAGFDNIGEVLTVSPLLVEKYLDAAERIAARALGNSKTPKAVSASYADDANYKEGVPFTGTNGSARRAGNSFIEVKHRIEHDGEYVIQAGLAGQRIGGKPVLMGFWVDGKLAHSEEIASTPPKTVYFSPFEMREFRVTLSEGVHQFRLGFANDEVGANLTPAEAFNLKSNKYPQYLGFLGPEPKRIIPPSRQKILTCDPSTGGATCIESILAKLARRAYRRPTTPGDVASLMKVAKRSMQQGLSNEQALQNAITAMLVSPDFLFRIERDPLAAKTTRRLNDIELASRLSYFIWSSMPDDELLALAEKGRLSTPATLDLQLKRMLADPRSSALADNFAGQWLETRNLDSIQPAAEKFPEWSPELKEAMRTETALLFDNILKENRPISEFLDARYTFLNETLAKFYGISGVTGAEFRKVPLENGQRGGVLTHGSVLAVSSYPTRTSVVLRGRYILENILGTPPPPPPANVPLIDEASTGTTVSLRQQMEKHRADPGCANCHSKMDPLGFALENFNAIGKWRTTDGKFPVDATGVLPDGTSFNGPMEMRTALLRKMPQFAQALAEKMLTYSLGRATNAKDRPVLASITKNWQAKEYRFQDLIFEVVHSLPFQSRRPEAASEVSQ